ncbi:TetR/AcrR family transcriptional regulator [Salinicoccus kekensis]|uniref:TetR family transcriptional regulator n=1 Tax=Salinicoccus kekensis TaxID=714307 RepID=A0A285UG14_9STAP|nr:TetR-like C-terminal domain-containing protein [Salinicoccus kekensis]SOC40779.1 TetR family transcriptional regulator [Salinicoccus kekensis]
MELNDINRQMKKKQLTEQLLKSAFVDLILENDGADAITVSEITDRADFNRGTFYIHYQNKSDLLEALYEDAIGGIHQSIRQPYKDMDKVLVDGVIPSNELIFEYIEANKKLFKALDLIEGDQDIYRRLESFLWNLFSKEIYVERESDTGETEYELFLSFQLHATVGVLKYWIKSDFIFSTEVMNEQLTSFYTDKVIALHFNGHNLDEDQQK